MARIKLLLGFEQDKSLDDKLFEKAIMRLHNMSLINMIQNDD